MKIYITLLCGLLFFGGCAKKIKEQERMCSRIDFDKIVSLFPKNVQEVRDLGSTTQDAMNQALRTIELVDASQRTFSNTIRPYDTAKFNFITHKNILAVLATLATDQALQLAAAQQLNKLITYETQNLQRNNVLYNALKQYHEFGNDAASKTHAVKSYIQKKLKKYDHLGMSLPVDQRAKIIGLEKEINTLEALYNGNIEHDKRQIVVPREALRGVPESFITTLRQNEQGLYVLSIDFTTFFIIMENCSVENTRKEYYFAFGQRGYPHNGTILKDLIKVRQQYAQALGFNHFAAYQVYDQMIKTTQGVEKFLWGMIKELQPYVDKDVNVLLHHLPPSVSLRKDGKIKPWDEAYIKSYYRKHYFNVYDYELADYFPLEHTLYELLRILHTVFNVEFEQQQVQEGQLWAPNVICYRVRSLKNQSIIGYLFLDLLQREHKKDSEAYHMSILPAIKDDCDVSCVGSSLVVANFLQENGNKPVVLGIHDVITLLHELGHALHELFGATKFVDYAGTQVVKDFVEAPSQMLELFLKQPKILQSISKHYQTGHSLSQEQIEQVLAAQKFGQAQRTLKQAFLGLVSWYMFKEGHSQDIHKLIEKIYKKVFKYIAYEPHHFFEYAFTHLTNYRASYYSYVWSQVIAADLFEQMHPRGIVDYYVSNEYVRQILAPGGLRAPANMLKKFLKRPFNHKAFFRQL